MPAENAVGSLSFGRAFIQLKFAMPAIEVLAVVGLGVDKLF